MKNAFGTDLGLATRHYIEFGISEGRMYNWQEPENDNHDDDVSDSDSSSGNRTETVTYEDGTHAVIVYKDGKTSSITHYDVDDKLLGKQFFNDDGFLILSYDYDLVTSDVAFKSTYTYGEKGELAKRETVELANGDTLTLTFEYDDKGNETCRTQYNNGEFTATFETKYNNLGQRTEVIETVNDGNVDGRVNTITKYEYYPDGVTQSEITYYGETDKKKIEIFRYPNNMIEREVHYNENGSIQQAAYFDEDGNNISSCLTEYSDDVLSTTVLSLRRMDLCEDEMLNDSDTEELTELESESTDVEIELTDVESEPTDSESESTDLKSESTDLKSESTNPERESIDSETEKEVIEHKSITSGTEKEDSENESTELEVGAAETDNEDEPEEIMEEK